ncbi:small conductance mechanosensitive channel [Thermoanaerobacter thermohydrosulfuricus]|uniref:Small-conductance mechanosensitive channel n=5 Tax=Thermoanaerobacter TaxID=1754 RepID=I8QYL5_9THEO|nr:MULTISPECIES: mechanosensitive ion channel family protein [Thermoanaerobacter]EGD50538.1 MscS Mechanosensitive ion channel [Thermoanaerobacter ethanolicus JW 200]AEM80021.1 MscS Mechanosensitive ion channel [Thermoanaerobacter wiegelii Rt8.B1]EIW00198.1 small-conductance mechanosensitive channel [Thermoanaerobacter siderophilus SR4]EMT39634.1 Small-conductance mechanosensitive channel [Thermoanaerobacter thermohydrosulfuricus WC1]SDG51120.1 small conductance mechanosensitive channel [Thermo
MMETIAQLYQKFSSLYDIKILKVTFDIIKILVIAFIGIKIGDILISRFYKLQTKGKIQLPERKIGTLMSLTKNILRYVIYFIAAASILKIFNIEMTSILAVAGIGSLAIGFGAQNLVKDVISGFFIIFEDQFGVGDYITINNFSGLVEEVGLRTSKIRDFSGDLHIIPNGEIKTVTNHTRGSMRALVNVGIPYEEDIDRIINVLTQICEDIKKSRNDVIEGPTVLGITDFQDSQVLITIIAKTEPMKQWEVERDIRYRIKKVFDREKITFPYPHTDVTITNIDT